MRHCYRSLVIVAGLLMLADLRAGAQTPFWEPLGGPPGGDTRTAHVTAEGEILIGLSGRGIASSTDAGRTWTRSTPAATGLPVQGVRVFLEHAGTIYAGGSNGVHRRTSPTTWTGIGLTGNTIRDLAAVGDTLFALGLGLRRSTNGGALWSEVDLPGFASVHAIEATPSGALLVGTSADDIFRSTDGVTWPRIPMQGPVELIAAAMGEVLVVSGDSLHRSTDDGLTWRRVETPLPIEEEIHRLTMSPTVPGLVAVVSSVDPEIRRISVSTDGGVTWTQKGDPAPVRPEEVASIAFGRGDTLLTATDFGLHRTTGAETLWTLIGPVENTVDVISEPRPGTLFAKTIDYLLHRSDDNGRTWKQVAVLDAFVNSHRTPIIAIGASSLLVGTTGGFRLSTDNGETWVSPEDDGDHTSDLERRGQTIYRLKRSGLDSSIDDGATWTSIGSAPETGLSRLRFAPSGTIYVGSNSAVYRLDRSLGRFVPLAPFSSSRVELVGAGPDSLLVAIERDRVLRSTDGGASWETLTIVDTLEHASDGIVLPHGHIYIAMQDGTVHRSLDRGVTWNDVSAGIESSLVGRIHRAADGRLIAGTQGDGLYASVDAVGAVRSGRARAAGPHVSIVDGRVVISSSLRSHADVAIHSIDGAHVATLRNESAGADELALDLPELPSGIYLIRVDIDGVTTTASFTVTR